MVRAIIWWSSLQVHVAFYIEDSGALVTSHSSVTSGPHAKTCDRRSAMAHAQAVRFLRFCSLLEQAPQKTQHTIFLAFSISPHLLGICFCAIGQNAHTRTQRQNRMAGRDCHSPPPHSIRPAAASSYSGRRWRRYIILARICNTSPIARVFSLLFCILHPTCRNQRSERVKELPRYAKWTSTLLVHT